MMKLPNISGLASTRSRSFGQSSRIWEANCILKFMIECRVNDVFDEDGTMEDEDEEVDEEMGCSGLSIARL